MPDAPVEHVVVEAGLELGPIVGLDRLDPERQPSEDLVEEADRGRLVATLVGAQDPDAGAVVDRGVLVDLRRDPGSGAMNLTSIWTRDPGCGRS